MYLTVRINSLGNHETDQSSAALLLINSYPRFCHHKGNVFIVHCILQPARIKKLCLNENLNADMVLLTVGFKRAGCTCLLRISVVLCVPFREIEL